MLRGHLWARLALNKAGWHVERGLKNGTAKDRLCESILTLKDDLTSKEVCMHGRKEIDRRKQQAAQTTLAPSGPKNLGAEPHGWKIPE